MDCIVSLTSKLHVSGCVSGVKVFKLKGVEAVRAERKGLAVKCAHCFSEPGIKENWDLYYRLVRSDNEMKTTLRTSNVIVLPDGDKRSLSAKEHDEEVVKIKKAILRLSSELSDLCLRIDSLALNRGT